MSKIVVVVPTIRPESHASFVKAWTPLFEKHNVTLVTVWDGSSPIVEVAGELWRPWNESTLKHKDLFCRWTDACRNLGFWCAAELKADYILTLDDDVEPCKNGTGTPEFSWQDPIQAHLDVLQKRVPISWMNTAHDTNLYLRGVPYGIRDEAPVMLSHGVWVGTPDFDGETQLNLETKNDLPHSLPYFVGPIPKGVLAPICGMNVMIRKEALPYFYFAPMGPDTGITGLNRFADIWMGSYLKKEFDRLGWAVYTGGSTVLHTRASDARKNFEQEKLGREWNERIDAWSRKVSDDLWELPMEASTQEYAYFRSYDDKRQRFAELIRSIQGSPG